MNDFKRWIPMLARAYQQRGRDIPQPDGRWRADTMRRIRRLGQLREPGVSLELCNRFLWRFAGVAGAVACVLALYASSSDFHLEYEMTRVFMTAPPEFDLLRNIQIL